MKKSLIMTFIFFVLFSTSVFAFGKKTITGFIQIYGNAPFTFVGFVASDGAEYSLDIDPNADFTIQDIKEYQGKPLKLVGIINEKELMGFQTLKDGRFVVSKFKVLDK